MILLAASILALALGPILYRFARTRPRGLNLIDGFIVVAISGLVLLRAIPEAVEEGGWWALPLSLLGLMGPTVLERTYRGALRQTHTATLALAMIGVGLHGLVDGAALNVFGDRALPDDTHLPLAVILHRVPVGIAIWWLLRPMGRTAAVAVLGFLSATTLLGFVLGPQVLPYFDSRAVAGFQALVAGSLMHVVLHRPAPQPLKQHHRWPEGMGAIAGVVLLVVMLGRDAHGANPAVLDAFLSLALESAGPLLLAYLMAGLFAGLLPTSAVRWMTRGGAFQQSMRGMLVGLPFPVCSCGVVPLYRAFVSRGVPATAAMAFLIATPELGLDAVLLSIPLLGPKMTVVRLVGAALVALLVGWLVGRRTPPARTADAGPGTGLGSDAPLPDRLRSSFQTGFGEVVDHTAAWILLGLAVAAMIHPILNPQWFRGIPGGLEVIAFALLGLPTYVCASGATPLVAVLLASGVSPGAALAFLVTGPATNLTTVGVLSTLHGRRVALVFALSMITIAVGLGYLVNVFLPSAGAVPATTTAETASPFQWFCLLALGLIFAFSLLRLGARRFFFENLMPDPRLAPRPAAIHVHE